MLFGGGGVDCFFLQFLCSALCVLISLLSVLSFAFFAFRWFCCCALCFCGGLLLRMAGGAVSSVDGLLFWWAGVLCGVVVGVGGVCWSGGVCCSVCLVCGALACSDNVLVPLRGGACLCMSDMLWWCDGRRLACCVVRQDQLVSKHSVCQSRGANAFFKAVL